jgi:hypothetical protein
VERCYELHQGLHVLFPVHGREQENYYIESDRRIDKEMEGINMARSKIKENNCGEATHSIPEI